MEMRLYLQSLQRGWWLIILAALSAISISLTISYLATPMYRSAARFIISPNTNLMAGRDLVSSLSTLDNRSISSTYAEVFGSDRLYANTLNQLGVDPAKLKAYQRAVVVLPETNVLELSITGPSPKVAADLANAIGGAGIDYVSRLNPIYTITFLDAATQPSTPESPQPVRDGGLALVLGAGIGMVLALLREQIQAPLDALRRRNTLDVTSSAFNRRHFQRALEEAVARQVEGNVGLGLVHLDGLRDLIETLPPAISQRLLHQVTLRLRNELRGNDIVGRWGDIRFAVMLPSTPAVAAERTLERIRIALTAPIHLERVDEVIQIEPYVAVSVSRANEQPAALISRVETEIDQARQKHLANQAGASR